MKSDNHTYLKQFRNPDKFNAELQVYQLGLPMIPKLLDYQEPDWLKMQRIDGLPYLDTEGGFKPHLLGETIANFHLATKEGEKCICHIDNQPQNILWNGERYFLIDFSDCEYNFPEIDISHLLLFWAAEFPHTLFEPSVIRFLKAYNRILTINTRRWEQCVVESINRFDERRRLYDKSKGKVNLFMKIVNREWLFSYFRK